MAKTNLPSKPSADLLCYHQKIINGGGNFVLNKVASPQHSRPM